MADISKLELNGTTYNIKASGSIPTSEKGAANGVASLDSTGKVPSSQLPSYVDDVLEYSAKSSFPATGESGKIYVDKSNNKTYRWSGSAYVEISESLALGETDSTAYRGDRGKTAYDHSQTTSGNPHNVTKSDVGLGNVGNFKAVSTVASQGLSDTEKSNARANIGAGTGNGTYSKPSTGIPKSDLASAVQTSLGKADSALQSHQTIKQDGVTGATVNRFGTCSIAAGTAAKTVSITTGTFTLEAGARVSVKFSNANTASSPTLNVNSTGAKNIFHKGAQITTGTNKGLLAGTVDFIYDGTQYHLIGNYIDTNTTYSSKSAASGGTDVSLVTTGEKYTWNNKGTYSKPSGGIPKSDLATAVQTSLNQVATNQTNILYAIKTGVKNIIVLPDGIYQPSSKTKFTVVDGAVTCETTASYTDAVYVSNFVIPAGTYSFTSTENNTGFQVRLYTNGTRIEGNPFTLDVDTGVSIALYSLGSNSSGTLTPMICLKSIYDQDSSYAKPTRQNSDLTQLEAEDRATLAEEIDGGAKNLLDTTTKTIYNMTFTKGTDEYVTVSPNASDGRTWSYEYCQYFVPLNAGRYVLVVDIKTATTDSHNAAVRIYGQTSGELYISDVLNNKTGTFIMEFTMSKTENCGIMIKQWNGAYRYMLCSKAAFDVSQTFVPYVPTLYQVNDRKTPKLHGAAVSSGDLNDINESEFRIYTNNVSNLPESGAGYAYVRTSWYDANATLQEATMMMTGNSYVRVKWAGTWKAWQKITNV